MLNENKTPENLLSEAILKEKPLVLFLGQEYSSEHDGDPVLKKFKAHLNILDNENDGWLGVIKSNKVTHASYEWLAERFERNILPESKDIIFEVAWSALFTTSIDPKITTRLETKGRVPESIISKDHYARVARSRSRPPVHYVFGKANELEGNYSVPINYFQLAQRKSIHSNPILSRIEETTTPLGLLVVDGYVEDKDWLSPDELLAPLSVNENVAILWLGKRPTNSTFYDFMYQRGQIINDERALSEVLVALLVDAGSFKDKKLGLVEQRGTETITLNENKFYQVPPSLRLRIEAVGTIIDDSWLEQPPLLLGSELEDDFRRFHGSFGGMRAQVEGIRKGYAVKRNFENELEMNFKSFLNNLGQLQNCIVIHGQSGTGKSVAIARMVLLLREELKLPVLYAKNKIPNATDVEELIADLEKAGAPCVVILCDSNREPERYRDLASGLKSRGRKCVVIGTSYKIEGIKKTDRGYVEAEARASVHEIAELKILINKFVPNQVKNIDAELNESNIFALLYRHLSMSRARIIDGITSEARNAEQVVRIRAKTMPFVSKPSYALAEKLIALGLGKTTIQVFEDESAEVTEAGLDAAGRLIDLVMVAGRLDCPVPLNLLLRALSSSNMLLDYVQVSYLFEELDLFRWTVSDAEGNEYLVQPRLRLEAELICRRRLSERSKEIECLLQLISSVRCTGADGRAELSFLLDLLGKMQREGPRKKAYQSGYLEVAKAITELRERNDVLDASLMLQESVFRRAAVQASDNREIADEFILSYELRASILNDARQIVEKARNEIEQRSLRASKKTKQSLAVEHASIYGYLAVGLARQDASEEIVWSHYLAAKAAVNSAISIANNHYPFDIALWTPADILKHKKPSLAHEMELRADIFSIFDQADTVSFNSFSSNKFKERKLRVALNLGNLELEEDAYRKLEIVNAPVAYYLKARDLCTGLFDLTKDIIPKHLLSKVSEAVEFLSDKIDVVKTDIRPLQLLIQLLWIHRTGTFIFQREKMIIPQDPKFQDEILSLVRSLNNLAGDNQRNGFRLLEAVFEWIRGSSEHAIELFKQLSSDTEFEDFSRVVRQFLLESENPKKGFNGRITRERGNGHWIISVQGLSKNIDLLGRDFIGEDLAIGREITNFNIAFNYLGPIAEPLSRYGVRS